MADAEDRSGRLGRPRWTPWVAWVLLGAACPAAPAETSEPAGRRAHREPVAVPACPQFGEAHELGRVETRELNELSGMVVSPTHPGELWAHNDSGDHGRLFRLRLDGTLLEIGDTGLRALDWEDMASHVDPDGVSWLVVGDIGDNFSLRPRVQLYSIPEPGSVTGPPPANRTARVRYPDGPHDAEALFVDPVDGSAYIVTKTHEPETPIYRVPAPLEGKVTAELVLSPPWFGGPVTGADINRAGTLIVIRTYVAAMIFPRAPGETIREALAREPCRVELEARPPGEAIAFSSTGSLLTAAEGFGVPIREYAVVER